MRSKKYMIHIHDRFHNLCNGKIAGSAVPIVSYDITGSPEDICPTCLAQWSKRYGPAAIEAHQSRYEMPVTDMSTEDLERYAEEWKAGRGDHRHDPVLAMLCSERFADAHYELTCHRGKACSWD